MKRVFADLHLCPDWGGVDKAAALVGEAGRLGFGLVGVTCPVNVNERERERLRAVAADAGVDLVFRVDLRPRSAEDLLRGLRRVRRRFEVVGVVCRSKAVARQAAKDRRVDLLSFPGTGFRGRFFDAAEAELASRGLACLEVDSGVLLRLEGLARVRLLSCLRREVGFAGESGVPVAFSSGVGDGFLLRRPFELAGLGFLFGLVGEHAVDAVSHVPMGIVGRNREKLGSGFVCPGVRVVKRGRDC